MISEEDNRLLTIKPTVDDVKKVVFELMGTVFVGLMTLQDSFGISLVLNW